MGIGVNAGRVRWSVAIVTAVMVVIAVVLAAQPAGGATKTSSGLATATKNVRALYKGSRTTRPPSTSPKPAKGKDVWMVASGLGAPSSLLWAKGVKDAGKALGWKVKVFDGKFSPQGWLEGVQQAIAAKADGIVLNAIDCPLVKAPLQQARAAGIKVVAFQGADCDEVSRSQKPLFDAQVKYATAGNVHGFVNRIDEAQADWVTVKTKGKGKIVLLNSDELVILRWQTQAFKARLKQVCPGCKIVQQIDFSIADLNGPNLRQKIEQALLKHPDATAVVAPFDDLLTSAGGSAAIRGSGHGNQINAIGATGLRGAIQEIQQNKGLDATVAYSFEWEGWAAMDTLNRVFARQRAVSSGIGLQLIDRGHNDKFKGDYVAPVDFKSAYRNAWRGR